MAKIGRNDPCPCGSGKKYKQCHGPVDEAREREQRQIKQAQDTLLAKVMDAAPRFASELGEGLRRFWNGKHTVEAIEELDDLEERGSERFLTWFMFDCRNAAGRTPLERLVEDPSDLDLNPAEATVLPTWHDVRLRPYAVVDVQRGQGLTVRPLWNAGELFVEDHAAARRIETGEVLVAHLTPTGDTHYVAGAAAQLTADTVEQLHEYADLHLENLRSTHAEATYDDLIHERSEIFNHFLMAVPREEQEANQIQQLIDSARVMLSMTAQSLGLNHDEQDDPQRRTVVPKAETHDDASAESDAVIPEDAQEVASESGDVEISDVTPRPLHIGGH